MPKCEIISIANQKGGVGKTTTTFNLGVALAPQGKRVHLIDADPQGDLTVSMGYYNQDEIPITLATIIKCSVEDREIQGDDYILHHKENVDLIPANLDLSVIEMSLVNAMSREEILKNCLEPLKSKYDYILINCIPHLGMLTLNALACSNTVIIPVQSQFLAAKGMTQLLQTISKVKRKINPKLQVGGILLTIVEKNTNLSKSTKFQILENYGSIVKLFHNYIPKAVKTAESSASGQSVFVYYRNGVVAQAYYSFSKEVLEIDQTRYKDSSSQIR